MNRIENLKKRHIKRSHEHWVICPCILAMEIRRSLVLDMGFEEASKLIQKEFSNVQKLQSK